jgi:hypothetical protein
MLPYMIPKANKNMSSFYLSSWQNIFIKKFDKRYMHLPSVDMLGIKNVPPNKL